MLILDLWGISFHPVVVVGLGNDLLFNFIVGHCGPARKELNVPNLKTSQSLTFNCKTMGTLMKPHVLLHTG